MRVAVVVEKEYAYCSDCYFRVFIQRSMNNG